MRTLPLQVGGLLLALGLATAARAQDPVEGFVVCYPNAPGSTRLAEPVMEELGDYLREKTGLRLAPIFFNEVEDAEAWLAGRQPRFGILSLALFLRWREQRDLEVLALSEREGAVEERYHLLVRGDAPFQTLEDLGRAETLGRQAVVWSTHLDDPRFASRLVFGETLEAAPDGSGDVRVVSTQQPLRALRRLKGGEDFDGRPVDAVLVDDATWRALQKLATFSGGALRPLYSTPPLPTPPVTVFGEAPAAEREALEAALLGMDQDPAGRELLEALRVTGFRAPEPDAVTAAVDAYDGGAE